MFAYNFSFDIYGNEIVANWEFSSDVMYVKTNVDQKIFFSKKMLIKGIEKDWKKFMIQENWVSNNYMSRFTQYFF